MEKNNIYERLLEQGFSKREIHSALYKFMLLEIQNNNREMLMLKQVQDVQHDDHYNDITPKKNHPHPVVRFFRKVSIRKHVIGKALSLLQSQFAKKPKNPV